MRPFMDLFSGAVNVPRFFEFELHTRGNVTDYWTTALNEDQDYITFSSWWDELIVTGIIPLSALVAFNLRIYLKLRASDHRGTGMNKFLVVILLLVTKFFFHFVF